MYFLARAVLDLPVQLSQLTDLRILHLNILATLGADDTDVENDMFLPQLPIMMPTGLKRLYLTEWTDWSDSDGDRQLRSNNLDRMAGVLRFAISYVA